MKIVHYCAHPGGFIYEWHQYHMVDELRRAGHEVIYLNPMERLGRPGSRSEYAQVLLEEIDRARAQGGCQLLFGTMTDETLEPGAVDEVRRRGVVAVNLSTDDYSHPFRVREIARHFDLNWSTVRESRSLLEGYGANVLVMPWGANPHVFRPGPGPEDAVVGFVGSPYGARARSIACLQAAGLPVRVHGPSPGEYYRSAARVNNPLVRALVNLPESWQRLRHGLAFPAGRTILASVLWRSVLEATRRLPEAELDESRLQHAPSPGFEALGEAFSRMAVSLGSIELSSTYVLPRPLYFIRLREFEVPMCGGVHLVNRFPELQEYFEEDREMLFYGGPEELVEKARFYLDAARDRARQQIRERARARAEGEHTWLHRFDKLGEVLGLRF